MSLDFENWVNAIKNLEEIGNKVKSVLGYKAINSDHYGFAILFNEYIDINTDDNKINDINNKYIKLLEDIGNMFRDYKIDLKEEYFSTDSFDGMLKFLDVRIDVYKGVDILKSTIINFANMYHKVKTIASKYDGLKDEFFYLLNIDKNNVIFYRLYNSCINSETSDAEIENIILNFFSSY